MLVHTTGIVHCHVTQKKCRKLGITETEIRFFYINFVFIYFFNRNKKLLCPACLQFFMTSQCWLLMHITKLNLKKSLMNVFDLLFKIFIFALFPI